MSVGRAGRWWPRWSAALLALGLAACGRNWDVATRLDEAWHRRSLEEIHLSRWLGAAPTANGSFNTELDRRWQPAASQPGDLVGQARTVYVMAAGYQLTGRPEYLAQVRRGADFLLDRYWDRAFGGWYDAVAADGGVQSSGKRLYGHAFALLAMASAYRATADDRYLRAARDTWSAIRDRFGEGGGGFRAAMDRQFVRTLAGHSQNPVMHLFEGLLALYEVSGDADARDGARLVGNFVAYRLLQGAADGGAYVPELYDDAWRPLDVRGGGRIDIGHQFEWAYLFSAGAERGVNPVYAGVAERLLKYALDRGYDRTEGGVFSVVPPSAQRKGYWQQAEALKALLHHAVVRERDDLWAYVTQMTEYVRDELVDEHDGGWRPAPRSQCKRGGCADRQPDGYHMVALHMEALRLAELARHRH